MDGDGGRLDDPLRGVPDAPQRQGGHLQGEQEKASGGVDLPWQTCLRVRNFFRLQILIFLLLSFIGEISSDLDRTKKMMENLNIIQISHLTFDCS